MFEDFGHDENPHALDPVEANAREGIREFFNTNRQRVFFSRQLEVQLRIVSFIGVEVKNTLGYMDRIEFETKNSAVYTFKSEASFRGKKKL